MESVEKYQQTGKEIWNDLRLSTHPVAVKYIKDESEIPYTTGNDDGTNDADGPKKGCAVMRGNLRVTDEFLNYLGQDKTA
ncbi:MAG: hypothetical protein HF978_19180 [Desulfobacteraceae bacterium]|nr:DUF169 domain-containing protein [Desulfobacteraceae bacterium]MBC2757673.1 hypothetical protein [Desulfobacteraceae bacterium]